MEYANYRSNPIDYTNPDRQEVQIIVYLSRLQCGGINETFIRNFYIVTIIDLYSFFSHILRLNR